MQGFNRKWHHLFHGLTANTRGHFTPVVGLKYYTTRKISARIICRARRKEISLDIIQNVPDCFQKVLIALSFKEGMFICEKLYQALDSPHMLL